MSRRDDTTSPTRQQSTTGITDRMSNMSISGQRTSTPRSSTGSTADTSRPKVCPPETFDGNQAKLEGFLLQVQLYLYFNRAYFGSEAEKVLYASSFLRGRAAKGFKPYLKDWLDSQGGDQGPKTETRQIFHDYDHFEIKLNELFGIPNEAVYADRHVRRLRQTTSVAIYASDFQGFSADLEWNDAALRSQFYLGLKDQVKAELYRNGQTTTLSQMIKSAIEIDERLQDLKQDRLMYYGPARVDSKATNRDPYGPRPMELDNTEQGRGRSTGRSRVRCYACQQEGHIARNCKKKRQTPEEFNSVEIRHTGMFDTAKFE